MKPDAPRVRPGQHRGEPGKSRSALEWVLVTLLLLLAAHLRFYDLGNIPKGLEHDEVATWHMVVAVLEGERPAVEMAEARCRAGPSHAAVGAVVADDEVPSGLNGFDIIG